MQLKSGRVVRDPPAPKASNPRTKRLIHDQLPAPKASNPRTKRLIHDQLPVLNPSSKRVRIMSRGSWTSKQMEEAIDAVDDGLMSLRKASLHFGIPKTTLRNWINGITEEKFGSVPRCLTKEEEAELVSWCMQMCDEGRGVTLELLRERVSEMAINRNTGFKDGLPGKGWWRGFKNRHPELSLRSAQCVEIQRVKAMNSDNLEAFYCALEKLLAEFKFTAPKIWNCDETGIQAGSRSCMRILAKRGARNVAQTIPKNREWMTVLTCVSAAGYVLPNLYVFKGERMRDRNLILGCEPGAAMAFQKKAWITNELFDGWLAHFQTNVPGGISPDNQHLLICDGHGSHVSLAAIQHAKTIGLHILRLPAHTSHKLQPLDVSCFSPFKTRFKRNRSHYMRGHHFGEPSKEDMATIVSTSLREALTTSNIAAGFKKTGIWPFDAAAVRADPYANSYEVVEDSDEDPDQENEGVAVEILAAGLPLPSCINANDVSMPPPVTPILQPPATVGNMQPSTTVVNMHPAPTAAAEKQASHQPIIARRSKLPEVLAGKLMVTSDEMIAARIEADRKQKEAAKARKDHVENRKKIQLERKAAKELDMKRRADARLERELQKRSDIRYEQQSAKFRSKYFDQNGKCKFSDVQLFGDTRQMDANVKNAREKAKERLRKLRDKLSRSDAIPAVHTPFLVVANPIVAAVEPAPVYEAIVEDVPFAHEHDAIDHDAIDQDVLDGHEHVGFYGYPGAGQAAGQAAVDMYMDSQVSDHDDEDELIACSNEDTHICSWDIHRNKAENKANVDPDWHWTDPDGYHGRDNVFADKEDEIHHAYKPVYSSTSGSQETDEDAIDATPVVKKTMALNDVYRKEADLVRGLGV